MVKIHYATISETDSTGDRSLSCSSDISGDGKQKIG